jgi:hypothetical protein
MLYLRDFVTVDPQSHTDIFYKEIKQYENKTFQRREKIVKKSLEITNFPSIKEKSWASRIVEGHLFNGKVRAEQCAECKCSCELVTFGCGNSNSILYGCTGNKCKHMLINIKFTSKVLNEVQPRSV